jgi:hypothetical protein
MAVELPRVQRAQPQAPQNTPKLDITVPNIAEAAAPLTRAISTTTEKVIEAEQFYQKKQQQVWDTKSTDINNQFERSLKSKLSEIKLKTGDVTKDFINYNKFAQKQHDELLSNYSDMDNEFKTLLSEKITNTYGRMNSFRDDQQYEQHFKFQNEASDGRVKLDVDNAFNKGMSLDVARPDTFMSFDAYIKRIEQTRVAQGDRTGMTVRDKNGVPDYFSGPVGVQIRKDVGDVLIPLVTSLNSAGKVAEGKEIIDRYSDYLNAADKARLLNDNNESDVKNQAINKLVELKGLKGSDTLYLADIDAMKGISEPIRFKMKELNQIEEVKKTQEQDRKREKFLDAEYVRLIDKQSSVNSYATDAEYINSPEGKNAAANTSPEQFERLRKVAFAPTKSSPSSTAMLNKGDSDGNLYKLSAEDRIKMYAGLSEEDRKVAREVMRQQSIDAGRNGRATELTGATVSDAKSTILKNINDQLQSNSIFEYSNRNKKYKNEEYVQNLIKQYGVLINNDILMAGPAAKTADVQDKITNKRLQQMINQFKKDKEDDSAWFGKTKFKGVSNEAASARYPYNGSLPKPKTSLPSTSGADKLQPTVPKVVTASSADATVVEGLPVKTDRKEWNKLYRKANGKAPTNLNDFEKFIEDTIKNK